MYEMISMKNLFLVFVGILSVLFPQAQHIGGLWQGEWASPEGFRFDFVMHIDEFPDGNMEGFLTWKVVATPESSWYYQDKIGLEATEFIRGRWTDQYNLTFEGYKKDDPNLVIDLDKYRLQFDESFNTFTGTTGNHGTWLANIHGTRIGLP